MKRLAVCLLIILTIPISANAQVAPGTAQATIQLPIQNIVSVNTTVVVPDSGRGMLSGLRSSGRANNGRGGQAGVANGNNLDASAFIHNFDELEENLGVRVADRLIATGKTADAIADLQKLAASAQSPTAREAASLRLEELKQEGLEKYLAAMTLARSGDKLGAADALDKLYAQYGSLILTPDRRKEQMRLLADPTVAEVRKGGLANQHLDKARRAEEQGKTELARVYYRMAARAKGTQASQAAGNELARLGPQTEKPNGIAARSSEDDPAQNLVTLARLYRKLNPDKARELYRQALLTLPADSTQFAQVAREAQALSAIASR